MSAGLLHISQTNKSYQKSYEILEKFTKKKFVRLHLRLCLYYR